MKTNKQAKKQRKNKHKKRFKVLLEIAVMTLGVLCAIMPQPFPLLVPILIGTVRIISNAVKKEAEPSTTPIVYCNGKPAPQEHNKPEKEQKQNVKTKKKVPGTTGARIKCSKTKTDATEEKHFPDRKTIEVAKGSGTGK